MRAGGGHPKQGLRCAPIRAPGAGAVCPLCFFLIATHVTRQSPSTAARCLCTCCSSAPHAFPLMNSHSSFKVAWPPSGWRAFSCSGPLPAQAAPGRASQAPAAPRPHLRHSSECAAWSAARLSPVSPRALCAPSVRAHTRRVLIPTCLIQGLHRGAIHGGSGPNTAASSMGL